MQHGHEAEDGAEQARLGSEADVQPVADHCVVHETSGEGVEREQSREPGEHPPRLWSAQCREGRPAQLRLDASRHPKRESRGRKSDRRIEKEEGAHGILTARQRGGKSAGRVEQPGCERVAGEGEVAAPRRHGLCQRGLLDRGERAQVHARHAEHPGDARGDEPRRLRGEGEVEPGQRHQNSRDRQHGPATHASRHQRGPESGERGGRQADPKRQADQRSRQAAVLQVEADEDRRKTKAEGAGSAPGEQQDTIHRVGEARPSGRALADCLHRHQGEERDQQGEDAARDPPRADEVHDGWRDQRRADVRRGGRWRRGG